MGFDTEAAASLAIIFLVPGYICQSFFNLFVPGRRLDPLSTLLQYVLLSLVNYVIFMGAIPLRLLKLDVAIVVISELSLAELGVLILGGPIALALLRAVSHRHRLLERALSKIPLLKDLSSPVDPIPSAWDWKFSRQGSPSWVVIRLADRTQVAGYFGKGSFSSSDAAERDIYLERVYTIDTPTKMWIEVERSGGILIKASEIHSVEFFELEETRGKEVG